MKRSCLFVPLLLVLACPVQAKIYLYVDADGRKGATDRRSEVPAGARVTTVIDNGETDQSTPRKSSGGVKTPTPANFPRIDGGTQKKRDDVRRTVLQEELASEQKNLEDAKRQLASGKKPLAGETVASPAYQARAKQLEDAVARHERNIAAIQKELGTSR